MAKEKKTNKGETMSIKKFISLLLLVVFTTVTVVPAGAVVTLDNAGTTLPTLAQDAGTKATGANRDVVPTTIRINFQAGDVNFGTVTGLRSNGSDGGVTRLTITANGKLSQVDAGANGTVTTPRLVILKPPTGTKFVALAASNFSTSAVALQGNGGLVTSNITATGGLNSNLPGAGTNGNAILAGVLTENGPSTYFGSTIPAGSLVAYFVTANTVGSDLNQSAAAVTFSNVGLAAEPNGDSVLATSGNISSSYQAPSGATVDEAMVSLSSETVTATALGARAGKVEFLMLGGKTGSETSTTEEPDNQPNTALASQLATAGTTVNIAPGLVTSTGSSLTTLNIDTDTLVLRAAERTDSTSSARTYYQTPFATSAVSTSVLVANGSASITTLNSDLTNATVFPNTTNALITVTFSAIDPVTSAAATDSSITVNAVTVSIFGDRAFNGLRNATGGGSTATLANGGFLGAAINSVNGSTGEANYGIGVLYNGTSTSSSLVVRDVTMLDYTTQTTKVGFDGTTGVGNRSVPNAINPATITNGTATAGLFPASLVTSFNNGTDTYAIVATANGNGASPFTFTTTASMATSAWQSGQAVFTPSEVSVRLVNSAGAGTNTNAWFVLLGNDNGAAITDGRFKVGATNTSTLASYLKGIEAPTTTGNAVSNNVVAVARLAGTTLRILPVTNRYDAIRDIITIRPEITLTLGTVGKTNGVRVVATASGGNLNGSRVVTVAEVLAAGSLSIAAKLTAVPVGGNLTSLMVENGTGAGVGRGYINLSSITGASTTTDALSDLLTTGKVLDNTVPPLFCGGTAGTGKNGPNGVVFQPKARAILIEENGTDAFRTAADASNTVIRVTLPTGWDLNAYNGSLANSQILNLISVATGSSTNPFNTAPSIVRVQPKLGTTITNAFIDIDPGSLGAPTNAVRRIIGLVFRPNALVVPSTVSSFAATISVVYTGGTNTRNAAITDDTTLNTIGTVSLGTTCSTFLTLNYCDDALSSYTAKSVSTNFQADFVANGSNLTAFSATPATAVRLVSNDQDEVVLPDLCIEEGVADALPIGQGTDGTPDIFGITAVTANGTGELHISSNYFGDGTNVVGFKTGVTPTVRVSDYGIAATTSATSGNEEVITLAEGTHVSRVRPFLSKTEFRVSGLLLDDPTDNAFVPPSQSFIAWFEADSATDYVVGSNLPRAARKDTVNGNFLTNVKTGTEANKMANNFYNGRTIDVTTLTATNTNFADTSASNNDLTLVFTNTNAARFTNAVSVILDDANYSKLSSATTLSVAVAAITGSTDVLATVSTAAGALEPGSTIRVTSTGTGPQDSVTVPVLADGSFKATVRAATAQTLTVVQLPDSDDTAIPPQIRTLNVVNQNVDPTLVSATATLVPTGSVPNKGKVAVVFQVVASGKVGAADFVPTAAQLTLGGSPVVAVTGTTNRFIGIADLTATDGLKVVATVTGSPTTSKTLTGITTSTVSKAGAPLVSKVVQTTAGRVIVKGKRLFRADASVGYITTAGTYTDVPLRATTKTDKERQRRVSASTVTLPTTAAFGVFIAPDRGVSSVEL